MNREQATEVVAVAVHQRAPAGRNGAPVITMALVHQVIAELARHPVGCGCGRCAAARQARPEQVWRIASARTAGIAATRAAARR